MKVVVLGFDGMDPELLDRLVSTGRLPAFSRLRERGAYSPLRSTTIPMSPAAWSTFLTGCNPGKHGIYDFVTRTSPESTEFEVISSELRRAPAIWEYLNDRGYRVGAAGVPATYPVEPIDGFVVSGFPTPAPERSYHPDDLADVSPVDPAALHPEVLYTGANADRFVDDQFRLWDRLEEFYRFALTDLDWDVLIHVFKGSDDVAHVAWDEEPLFEIYERADGVVDHTLGVVDSLDEDCLLVVMSDHGFGPVDRTLFLNNVLLDLGYARFERTVGTRLRRLLHRNGANLLAAYRLLSRLGLAEGVLSQSYDEDAALTRLLQWLRERVFLSVEDIDLEGSACFSRGNFGQLFLNDPAVADALAADLLAYTVEGEPIVEAVHRAEEAFHGPFVDLAPDLMIETPGYRYVTSRGFALATDSILTEHVLQRTADHKPLGVLFAHGAGVDPDAAFPTPTLEDLLPTIMYALDAPIPEYVDGEVVPCVSFERDPRREAYDLDGRSGTGAAIDEERVREQLRSLGYTG